MKYRRLGGSGLELSVIGQGSWAMGGDFFGDVDESAAIRAIHASIGRGVNLIDTAPAYGANGEAETVVGKAIYDRRDKVILATKCGVLRVWGEYVRCLSPSIIRRELEGSLKRLKTDVIDLYQIHWPDYNCGMEGALDTLAELKKEGKIREIGVSNFSAVELQAAFERAGICSVQTPFNILNRSGIQSGVIPAAVQNNIGILSYGTLEGGVLAGRTEPAKTGNNEKRATFYKYFSEPKRSACKHLLDVLGEIAGGRKVTVAEVSIGWVVAQEGITCALAGSVTPQQAEINARAGDLTLVAGELAAINAAYECLAV